MDIKITFQGMAHSDAMESFIREKIDKIPDLFKKDVRLSPFRIEVFLEMYDSHKHNRVTLRLKTPRFVLSSNSKHRDIYFAIEETVDQIIELLKKEKDKKHSQMKHTDNEKTKFYK